MRSIHVVLAVWLAAPLFGQILTVNPNVVAPGASTTVNLVNTTTSNLSLFISGPPRVRIFRDDSELVYSFNEVLLTDSFIATTLSPNQMLPVLNLNTATTTLLPMADGHYFAEYQSYPFGLPVRVVGSFTVGTPPGPQPTFLARFGKGYNPHASSLTAPQLRLSNGTATGAALIGLTWSLQNVGSPTILASGTLGNTPVGASASEDVPLPSAAFVTGTTMNLVVSWIDPTAGPVTRTLQVTGPEVQNVLTADMYFPYGRTIPLGGILPIVVKSRSNPVVGFVPIPLFSNEPQFPGNSDFALALSFSPGAIHLVAGGASLPLALDGLLQSTVAGLLQPWLPGSPGTLSFNNAFATGLPFFGPSGYAGVVHPGPAVSGITVCCAAVTASAGFPAASFWQTSMLRTITFQ